MRTKVLSGFRGEIARVRTTPMYQLGILLTALLMVVLPLIYLAITLVITRCFKYVEYALSKHQRPLKNTAAISGQVRHAD